VIKWDGTNHTSRFGYVKMGRAELSTVCEGSTGIMVLKLGTVDNSLRGIVGEFGRKNTKNDSKTQKPRPISGHQRLISLQWQPQSNPAQ
jgi:hypothetical protein